MALTRRSKASEARDVAGYGDDKDWSLFNIITKREAQAFARNNKHIAWSDAALSDREVILEAVNKSLKECRLQQPPASVTDWRMARAVGECNKPKKHSSNPKPCGLDRQTPALFTPVRPLKNEAANLISLLRCLCTSERSIKKALLLAIGAKRKEWTASGNLYSYNAVDFGLKYSTVLLFQDETTLQGSLDLLEASGAIRQLKAMSSDTSESVEIFSTQMAHSTTVEAEWKEAMTMSCFFFSGCEYSPNFQTHGKWALPLFQSLLDRRQADYDVELARKIILALLQASKFSTTRDWKLRAIDIAERIGLDRLPTYIRAYFAYRKSLILRDNRDLEGAEQIIENYFQMKSDPAIDQRLNAIHGLLHHSLAWIEVERGHFRRAIEISTKWSHTIPFLNNCSVYELRVFLRHVAIKGVAKMHTGEYKAAITDFRAALGTYDEPSRARQIVLANLIDACCESKDLDIARSIADEEFQRLAVQRTHVQETHLEDPYLRDILISAAELHVRRNERDAAHGLLQPLRAYFRANHVAHRDQQRHIRVLILRAQNIHQHAVGIDDWQHAWNAWQEIVAAAHVYPVLSVTGWDYGLVCFSIFHIASKVGESGAKWLQQGCQNFENEDRFWRRGMSTYWLPYIIEHVADVPNHVKALVV